MKKNRQEPDVDSRAQRIRQVISDCLFRRNCGEEVSDDSLIEAHADLMPELAKDLQLIRLFENYHVGSADIAGRGNGGQREMASPKFEQSVRCPHCHEPIPMAENNVSTKINCGVCGNQFTVIGADTDADDTATTMVGHLQLIHRLGTGGFGTVWKAYDTQLDRTVAVKLPHLWHANNQEPEQFLREARTAAQLQHPNIVRVLEFGCHQDQVFIVSEHIQGVTLAEWTRDHQMTSREVALLCVTLSDAMHYAHQAGIIHRDLKPGNIMLDDLGVPHVMDFGLAKRDTGEVTMTATGQLLGTPAYMSPEQARGEAHQADRRADIYSLGAILFELLTGELPFRGSAGTIVRKVIEDEPPRPSKLNSRIPQDLETICLKCLEKNPDRRYRTALELADELRRFLQGRPILARPTSVIVRAMRWSTRNPMAAMSTALLLALALVGPIIASHEISLRKKADTLAANESKARGELYRSLYVADMQRAFQVWETGDIDLLEELLTKHQHAKVGQQNLRGFEYQYLQRCLFDAKKTPSLAHEDAVTNVAYSPDGSKLATVSGKRMQLWDLNSNTQMEMRLEVEHPVKEIAFSPRDNMLVAFAIGNSIQLWDVAAGGRTTVFCHSGSGCILPFVFARWAVPGISGQQPKSFDLERRHT